MFHIILSASGTRSALYALGTVAFLLVQPAMATEKKASQPETGSYIEDVPNLIKAGKLQEAQLQILNWEKVAPDDADLAATKANYLLALPDSKSNLVIEALPPGSTDIPAEVKPGALALYDTQTSRVAGFIGEIQGTGRPDAVAGALKILSEAAQKHPERLDIHLGILTLYAMQDQYEQVLKDLNALLADASEKKFQGYRWMGNASIQNSSKRLSDTAHHYYSDYSRGPNPDDKLAFKFAQLETEFFPDDVRSWNNLSAEYLQKNDQNKSLECLLKAHKLEPLDRIILMNIAHLYTVMNQNDKAIQQYEKIIELKDSEFIEDARQAIQKLKNIENR